MQPKMTRYRLIELVVKAKTKGTLHVNNKDQTKEGFVVSSRPIISLAPLQMKTNKKVYLLDISIKLLKRPMSLCD